MNINSSISALSYTPATLNKNLPTTAKSDVAVETATNQSKARLASAQQTAISSPTSAQGVPDEAYAIPAWQTGYYHDITYMTVLGTPANYVDPKSAGLAAGSPADNLEYGQLLRKHVHEVYEKNGLSDAGERYKALSVVKGLDERLHKEFTDSVNKDPRMMELMGKLGVSLV